MISVAVDPAMIHTDKQIDKNANGLLTITGTSVTLSDFPAGHQVLNLTLGLVRPKQDTLVEASLYNRDHALVGTSRLLLSHVAGNTSSSRVKEWVVSAPPSQPIATISIRAHLANTGAPASMIIFDPIVAYPASGGALLELRQSQVS